MLSCTSPPRSVSWPRPRATPPYRTRPPPGPPLVSSVLLPMPAITDTRSPAWVAAVLAGGHPQRATLPGVLYMPGVASPVWDMPFNTGTFRQATCTPQRAADPHSRASSHCLDSGRGVPHVHLLSPLAGNPNHHHPHPPCHRPHPPWSAVALRHDATPPTPLSASDDDIWDGPPLWHLATA